MKRDVSLREVIAVIISSELENRIMNKTHHADGARGADSQSWSWRPTAQNWKRPSFTPSDSSALLKRSVKRYRRHKKCAVLYVKKKFLLPKNDSLIIDYPSCHSKHLTEIKYFGKLW